ncbi:MAG: hypothetical protein FWH55_13060, partial [Oscillospiraceae bacterium]|nr:hypothetical protein [Oscillospiraceae bacterium]
MKKRLALLLSFLMVFAIVMPAFAAQDTGAVASAYVERLNGSQNRLFITITLDGATIASESFMIPNNAKGEYALGGFNVYVATSGNTKIDACYIIPPDLPVLYQVNVYALDGVTLVYSQIVAGGDFFDGTDQALVDTWSSADALWANYQISGNLRVKADWLKDLDTGDEFDWTVTPINKVTNVTLALEEQYDMPPSPAEPVEFVVEMPTLISLGFEWYIKGDDNGN